MKFNNKYRIVHSGMTSLCFDPQVKFWWLPFIWMTIGGAYGLSRTLKEAEGVIAAHRKKGLLISQMEKPLAESPAGGSIELPETVALVASE